MNVVTEDLITLLKKAIGDRSLNQFALHSGVDAAILSRAFTKQRLPSPKTLKKIAERAYNNVTYEQLMSAAGYLDNKKTSSEKEDVDEWVEALKTAGITPSDLNHMSNEDKSLFFAFAKKLLHSKTDS